MALVDGLTQLWVRATGRNIDLAEDAWLDGPYAGPNGVGEAFFAQFAEEHGLRTAPAAGLLESLEAIDPDRRLHPSVSRFYTDTSDFDIDAWAEWNGALRPFGALLGLIFSRRLQQLNVPLSALDVSRGMRSCITAISENNARIYAAWTRTLIATGRVIYSGAYSHCSIPSAGSACVRVVFPLPNGSATVIMEPEIHADGSLTLHSRGTRFGESGFYFVVRRGDTTWARFVRAMHEYIHVYWDGSELRTDHVLRLFGIVFLRIHYRLRDKSGVCAAEKVSEGEQG